MLFEIFIEPQMTDLEVLQNNLNWFFKYKNYLQKHKIIIYTKFNEDDFNIKKVQKLDIQYVKITDDITSLKKLWIKYIDNYKEDWIIHYNIKDKMIEFDFIKMIFKKQKDTFVRRNNYEIYENLFCINLDLMIKFITSNLSNINPEFIVNYSRNYYFLKYMNIITKNRNGFNIYI